MLRLLTDEYTQNFRIDLLISVLIGTTWLILRRGGWSDIYFVVLLAYVNCAVSRT